MKKKVLITATAGGFLFQFERNNARLLKEAGFEVHYGANFQNEIYQWDKEIIEKEGVVLHHIPFENSIGAIKAHRQAFRRVLELMDQEEITLLHCHTPFAGVISRLAANYLTGRIYKNKSARVKKKIHVIYTTHGFHFFKNSPKKNWLFYPVEKHLSKKTDILITINREDYRRARNFSIEADKRCKVEQIPGVGLDTEKFQPMLEIRDCMREKLQIPKDAFHLVSIGELSADKNISVIITALHQLKHLPIYYSIFGKGPEMEHLSGYINACGLEDKISLCGYTTEAERVLQSADLFVFPSLREGLGMAALEAMACSVPVIAYDNRGTREYMQHEVNGLVCETGEPKEYVQLITQMYNYYRKHSEQLSNSNNDTYYRMQLSCRQTAERFCLTNTEKIMRKIYQSIR